MDTSDRVQRPFCFVLMPIGKRTLPAGILVDFDAIYREVVAPALQDAGLAPVRADGDCADEPTRERVILCDFAVADLSTAHPCYELGQRDALRPGRTVLMFAEGSARPPMRCNLAISYRTGSDGAATNAAGVRAALLKRLQETPAPAGMTPLFQLLEGDAVPEVKRLKTDVFRERVNYSPQIKERLAAARKQGAEALQTIEREWGDLRKTEAGAVIDLFLSYRAVEAWRHMIELALRMPPPLGQTLLVQEQLGLALNRLGRADDAERLLKRLIAEHGPSSETCPLLGRVYKDSWDAARRAGDSSLAEAMLDEAISAYLTGFEADWRDAYPGINAVTLMELKNPPDPRRLKLLPVVTYAVERRIATGEPDYWDYATLLELAVLARDADAAADALRAAQARVREVWEPKTTLRNLQLIREAREQRQEIVSWERDIERSLEQSAKPS